MFGRLETEDVLRSFVQKRIANKSSEYEIYELVLRL